MNNIKMLYYDRIDVSEGIDLVFEELISFMKELVFFE